MEKKRLGAGMGAMASFRLARTIESIENDFREEFLPDYLVRARMREVINFSKLTTTELVDLFDRSLDDFATDHYYRAELINIGAAFCLDVATSRLTKKGLDPAAYLSQGPETVVHHALGLSSRQTTRLRSPSPACWPSTPPAMRVGGSE